MKRGFIYCCECRGIPEYARSALELIKGNSGVYDLAGCPTYFKEGDVMKITNNSSVGDVIRGIQQSKKKYAYYIQIHDNGDLDQLWDLMSGERKL